MSKSPEDLRKISGKYPADVRKDLLIDVHHGLPRSARWLEVRIEDLKNLPKDARILWVDGEE